MRYKQISFPLPTGDEEIELEVEYGYYYDPGKYSGRPEDCYPEEEECVIVLEEDWEKTVMARYCAAGIEAIKNIEAQVQQMITDKEPAEWAKEDDCDEA